VLRPTTQPTIDTSQNYVSTLITKEGTYSGRNNQNEEFIIQINRTSSTPPETMISAVVNGGKGGRKIYIIYPMSFSTVTLTTFDVTVDVLDLRHFPSSLQAVSYQSNPLKLILPDGQVVVLTSLQLIEQLTPQNILYPTPTTSSSQSAEVSQAALSDVLAQLMTSEVMPLLVVFFGLIAFFAFLFRQSLSSSYVKRSIRKPSRRIIEKDVVVSNSVSDQQLAGLFMVKGGTPPTPHTPIEMIVEEDLEEESSGNDDDDDDELTFGSWSLSFSSTSSLRNQPPPSSSNPTIITQRPSEELSSHSSFLSSDSDLSSTIGYDKSITHETATFL
jgi:hypothetical protein